MKFGASFLGVPNTPCPVKFGVIGEPVPLPVKFGESGWEVGEFEPVKVCVSRFVGEYAPGIGTIPPPVDMGTIRFIKVVVLGGALCGGSETDMPIGVELGPFWAAVAATISLSSGVDGFGGGCQLDRGDPIADRPIGMRSEKVAAVAVAGGCGCDDVDASWSGEYTGDIGRREYIENLFGGGEGDFATASATTGLDSCCAASGSSFSSGMGSGMSTGGKENGCGGGSIGVSCSKSRLGEARFAKLSFPGDVGIRSLMGEDGVLPFDVRGGDVGGDAWGRFACRRSLVEKFLRWHCLQYGSESCSTRENESSRFEHVLQERQGL